MSVLVVLAYLGMAVLTLPKLLRAKQYRDAVAFCAFVALSLVLSVMAAQNIPIPNPFNAYNNLLQRIGLHY